MLNFLKTDGGAYFARIAAEARDPGRIREIQRAIDTGGCYEQHVEWRISTVTSTRVVPAEQFGQAGFDVTVECSYKFHSWSPTIERAAEFAGMYERMIPALFFAVGWPSWAAKDQLRP